MRIVLAILIFACWPLLADAQEPHYSFSQIDISKGLSNNQVNCIFKDQRGFLWFGTMAGLNRYDGYDFKVFKHNDQDTISVSDDNILQLFEGPGNKMWLRTQSAFNIYDPVTEKIDRRTDLYLLSKGLPKDGLVTILKQQDQYFFVYADAGVYHYSANGLVKQIRYTRHEKGEPNPITAAALDSKNYLWVIRYNGLLEKFDKDQGKLLFQMPLFQQQSNRSQQGNTLFIDEQDEIWYFQRNYTAGVIHYNPARNLLERYHERSSPVALSSNAVTGINQDQEGVIWISTDHGGVNLLNKSTQTVEVLKHKEGNPNALAENAVYVVYRDDLDIIWLGTYKKGISYFDRNRIQFPLTRHHAGDPNSLPFEDINVFVEDKKGNLWIGSNGGGLIYYDRQNNLYKQYRHSESDPQSLSNDVIVSLCLDHAGKLWIGTYLGGMDMFNGKSFTHYRHNPNDPYSIGDDKIFSIYEDQQLNLWIGTLSVGLDRLDRSTNRFYHYNLSVPNTLHNDNVTSIAEDSRGNIWVGTSWGIDVLDKLSGRFTHYSTENSQLSYNSINGIREDYQGNIWVATNRGLNILPRGKTEFFSFSTKDGLPDNTVLDIVEDNQKQLWVSTKGGLSKIKWSTTETGLVAIHCQNYDEHDGLQGREFNRYAAYKTRAGEMIFGGAYGFNLFRPETIQPVSNQPPLVLTDFQLFNRSVRVGESVNNSVVLPAAASEINALHLKHNQNDFSFEFAALGYSNAAKIRYAYLLEGFNKDWVYLNGTNRTATYTNMDPGNYRFRVKLSSADGVWQETPYELLLTIAPPFWKTPFAYLLYFILAAGALYFLRRQIIRREQTRMQLAVEREETRRIRELDGMKTRFFTNVSHEFKTPISLILIPIQRMIKETPSGELKAQFELIHRNARRLLNMVNELLDFRKMEENELQLRTQEADIVERIQELAVSFNDMASNKNIQYRYKGLTAPLVMSFDPDKLERILFNLLSNAFKFTPESGQVTLEVNTVQVSDRQMLQIKVQDTGIGIPADQHEKIFDRFYQSNPGEQVLNQGSGIGLSITREFVELHGGIIQVLSEKGKGACFTVFLPIKTSHVQVTTAATGLPGHHLFKKPTILLVEDNHDFRTYLRQSLAPHFTILEAAQGMEGWKKVLGAHPDLVVSDISMPLLSGIELCKKIKQDPRTRHIPVILLTALEGQATELAALETGPNDYITKPFNYDILFSRIKNLLNYQTVVKETYQKQLAINPSAPVEVEETEDMFIKKALVIIEKNMANPEFNVDNLRQELLLSRTSMYKKILAVTGKTPIEFIRQIRLKRAAQLLARTSHNVTEVAYMVGFNNPKYFTKYFKEEFGQLPSLYQQDQKAKTATASGSLKAE